MSKKQEQFRTNGKVIDFDKHCMSKSQAEDLVVDYESIKKENLKYNQTLDTIDGLAAKNAAKIVSGENLLFRELRAGERNMVLGFIGLVSEISKYLMQPEESLMECDSMLENYVIKNNILIVSALKKSFLMNRNNGFQNTSEIINWMTLEILETSSEISKKIEEKWPHPKKEDYEKEDFNIKNWPQPKPKDILFFVYEDSEFKILYSKIRDALHGYTNSIYNEISKPENIENSTWMLDIFKDVEKEDLLNKIELVKNVEHQYIDWLFDEKIKEASMELLKSSFNLIDLMSIAGISLKKFLSYKTEVKEEETEEANESEE